MKNKAGAEQELDEDNQQEDGPSAVELLRLSCYGRITKKYRTFLKNSKERIIARDNASPIKRCWNWRSTRNLRKASCILRFVKRSMKTT